MLFPLISVFLQLAPRENKYLIVSSAPEVAASNNGVHWFLKIKKHIMIIEHIEHQIYLLKIIQIAIGGRLIYTITFSLLHVIVLYVP